MKKAIFFITLLLLPISVFAQNPPPIDGSLPGNPDQDRTTVTEGNSGNTPTASTTPIKITTTEPVPGGKCVCKAEKDANYDKALPCIGPVQTRKYECTVQPGMTAFQQLFATIVRYVINIVLLLGVLAIVGLGIVWSLAGGDDVKYKTTLKKWAINVVIGLAILFFFRYILTFLAPWIYK